MTPPTDPAGARAGRGNHGPMPGTPARWCDEAILRALRDWTTEFGQPPGPDDWSGERSEPASLAQRKWMREHPYWPSSSCVARHFGSWNKALRAAGLRDCAPDAHDGEPTTAPAWTIEAVRAAIRDWTDTYGRPPSYHEWTPSRTHPRVWDAKSPRWPSAAAVCSAYDDYRNPWTAALTDADAPITMRHWNDTDVRAALASFWALTGRRPTPADLTSADWHGPCARTLRRRYGGLDQAWETLGPVPI